MRALVLAGCAAFVLAAPAATSGEPRLPAAKPVIKLYAPNHHPQVGHDWRIKITAYTTSGRALAAEVRYQYLYGGQVVARRSHYRFRGTFRDNIDWPAQALGYRLTFRCVVKTKLGTRNLDWWVVVRR